MPEQVIWPSGEYPDRATPDGVEPESEEPEKSNLPEGHIKIHPHGRGGYVVEVDGVDIGHVVVPDQLQMGFTKDCKPWVHMRLMPRTMIVDLPNTVISAVQAPWIGPNDG